MQTRDGISGNARALAKYAVDEQNDAKAGHFRHSLWFPKGANARTADFSELKVTAKYADGSEVQALGMVAPVPGLFKLAVSATIECDRHWIFNTYRQRRGLLWYMDDDDRVVFVKSTKEDLVEALSVKRRKEVHDRKQNKIPVWMTTSDWNYLAGLTMIAFTKDKESREWCEKYASLGGSGAPWAKKKTAGRAAASDALARGQPRGISAKAVNARATKARVANERGLAGANLSELVGSIPVFDVGNKDHTPVQMMKYFSPFLRFTATTLKDLDDISNSAVEIVPFPFVPSFEKPTQDAPDISKVQTLYNLRLMVGRSVMSDRLFVASRKQNSDTMNKEGLVVGKVKQFRQEVRKCLEELGEEADTVGDE